MRTNTPAASLGPAPYAFLMTLTMSFCLPYLFLELRSPLFPIRRVMFGSWT